MLNWLLDYLKETKDTTAHLLLIKKTKRELHKLTDKELRDIGLFRGEIDRIIEQEYIERKYK